jgi:hypothetical protein
MGLYWCDMTVVDICLFDLTADPTKKFQVLKQIGYAKKEAEMTHLMRRIAHHLQLASISIQ